MNFNIGTLYDSAKDSYNKMNELTKQQIMKRCHIFEDYVKGCHNQYYMLLCRERNDYTLFNHTSKLILPMYNDIIDCLRHRGATIKDISLDIGGGVEFFVTIDSESFAYYFFPYDNGVIEC